MKCCNCGADRDLKAYYIVPLDNGGNDIESNKVYLCRRCARLSHLSNMKKNGRPNFGHIEDFEDTIRDWFNCKIGTKEAKELIGLNPNNQSTWSRLKNEYKEKYNIEDNRNNIDILDSKGLDTYVIGYIKYKDKNKIRFTRDGAEEVEFV